LGPLFRWPRGAGAVDWPETWQQIRDTITSLRTTRYDLIIDTQGLIRSAVMSRLAHGERHGYDASSIKEPFAARFYDRNHQVARDLHAVTRNRQLAAASVGYAVPDRIDYGLSRPAKPVGHVPRVLLVHGTSRSSKEWPEAAWIELGRWLQARGFEVALPWGTQAERERSERIANAVPSAQVIARQSLDATARIVAASDLVIGVDTGLLHLAAAYQVPLAGLYVSTAPGLTGPVGQGPIVTLNAAESPLSVANVTAAIAPLLPASAILS
jgi:heptosyltransferase-1